MSFHGCCVFDYLYSIYCSGRRLRMMNLRPPLSIFVLCFGQRKAFSAISTTNQTPPSALNLLPHTCIRSLPDSLFNQSRTDCFLSRLLQLSCSQPSSSLSTYPHRIPFLFFYWYDLPIYHTTHSHSSKWTSLSLHINSLPQSLVFKLLQYSSIQVHRFLTMLLGAHPSHMHRIATVTFAIRLYIEAYVCHSDGDKIIRDMYQMTLWD